jgi:hypothetical protein
MNNKIKVLISVFVLSGVAFGYTLIDRKLSTDDIRKALYLIDINIKDEHIETLKNLEQNGIITNEEFVNATFTQHYRTVEEFRKPFDDPNSEISKSGLILKRCETMFTDCPFKVHYNKNKSTMSSREYAETLIPTMRSWSETVFKTALEKRNPNEINQIVDQFYNAYLEEVTENPSGHAMDYIHIVMDIEKKIN